MPKKGGGSCGAQAATTVQNNQNGGGSCGAQAATTVQNNQNGRWINVEPWSNRSKQSKWRWIGWMGIVKS